MRTFMKARTGDWGGGSQQRLARALHRDYERGVARMKKWTAQVQDIQGKIEAQNKDLDAIQRRLDSMGSPAKHLTMKSEAADL